MTQIFVSHSQLDRDIRGSFDSVFARAGVIGKCMEFEKLSYPQWRTIKDEMYRSDAVFLLLGPNIRSSIYTQNWVASEVGLACGLNKDVWVFEQHGVTIDFPIPYLTDYMIYDLSIREHFEYVRNILEGYKRPPTIFPLFADPRDTRGIPKGAFLAVCPHEGCGMRFFMHTSIEKFYCPSCRRQLEMSTGELDV